MNIGVYFLLRSNKVVYIGKSIHVDSRIKYHSQWIKFDNYRIIECAAEVLDFYEKRLIQLFRPEHNRLYNLKNTKRVMTLEWLTANVKDTNVSYEDIIELAKKAKHDLPYSHNMNLSDVESSIMHWIKGTNRPYKSSLCKSVTSSFHVQNNLKEGFSQ